MTVDVHPEPTHKQMEDRARCTKRDGMVVQEVIDNLVISLLYAYIVIMKAATEPLVIEYTYILQNGFILSTFYKKHLAQFLPILHGSLTF